MIIFLMGQMTYEGSDVMGSSTKIKPKGPCKVSPAPNKLIILLIDIPDHEASHGFIGCLFNTPSFPVYKAYTYIKIQTLSSLTNNLTIKFLFL
jgi:hypothetical protein